MIQARREAGVIRHYLGASIPFSDMNARLRVRFDHLRADGIIERKRRRLPGSHIALYRNCRLAVPPIRALITEWDDLLTSTGNPADI